MTCGQGHPPRWSHSAGHLKAITNMSHVPSHPSFNHSLPPLLSTDGVQMSPLPLHMSRHNDTRPHTCVHLKGDLRSPDLWTEAAFSSKRQRMSEHSRNSPKISSPLPLRGVHTTVMTVLRPNQDFFSSCGLSIEPLFADVMTFVSSSFLLAIEGNCNS